MISRPHRVRFVKNEGLVKEYRDFSNGKRSFDELKKDHPHLPVVNTFSEVEVNRQDFFIFMEQKFGSAGKQVVDNWKNKQKHFNIIGKGKASQNISRSDVKSIVDDADKEAENTLGWTGSSPEDNGDKWFEKLKGELDLPKENKSFEDHLILLQALRSCGDGNVKKAADIAHDKLFQMNTEMVNRQKPLVDEPIEGFGRRMPSDCIIHCLSTIKKIDVSTLKEDESKLLKNCNIKLRSFYLKNSMTLEKTKELFREIISDTKEVRESSSLYPLKLLVNRMVAEDPVKEINAIQYLPVKAEKFHQKQLYEALYPRVFNSIFISSLVESPPEAIKKAMKTTGLFYSSLLEGINKKNSDKALECVRIIKKSIDDKPRGWFKDDNQHFQNLKKSENDKDFMEALLTLLCSDITTGEECIAIPYFAVELSLAFRKAGFNEYYQMEADQNYLNILKRATNRQKPNTVHAPVEAYVNDDGELKITADPLKDGELAIRENVETKGGGITMGFQPNPNKNAKENSSIRPVDTFRPRLLGEDGQVLNTRFGSIAPTDEERIFMSAVDHVLSQGGVYVTGVSGSTNILLYLLDYLRSDTKFEIDSKSYLMGVMMFLVHDGGHAMHESMWTANLLDEFLDLNLSLSENDRLLSDKRNKAKGLYKEIKLLIPTATTSGINVASLLMRANNDDFSETDIHHIYGEKGVQLFNTIRAYNQLQKELDELIRSAAIKKLDYVVNYEDMVQHMLDGHSLQETVKQGFEQALDNTIEYFDEHSLYSGEGPSINKLETTKTNSLIVSHKGKADEEKTEAPKPEISPIP